MNKIEIYTNETCPYCKQIKDKLTEEKIEFESKLTKDFKEEYQEAISLTGMPSVPTIKYKGEYFVPGRDFQNAQQLINLLNLFEPSKYNDSRRVLERIKTLNYNMNIAFGRVDKLLRQIETKINTEDEHKSTD